MARFCRADSGAGQNEGMYCLEAVIAREAVLRRVAGSVDAARVVPLGQDLSPLLMTDDFFDAVTVAGELVRVDAVGLGWHRETAGWL
ncbi:hypothetical protein ACIOD2_19110 [Amycolatopsis sp. NPDC088138]|uniref:hypothetical protein n=1 Tax=Amycolatopsis sp. NPDC088138 TaxID=3363938 RepID=UPI003803B0E0